MASIIWYGTTMEPHYALCHYRDCDERGLEAKADSSRCGRRDWRMGRKLTPSRLGYTFALDITYLTMMLVMMRPVLIEVTPAMADGMANCACSNSTVCVCVIFSKAEHPRLYESCHFPEKFLHLAQICQISASRHMACEIGYRAPPSLISSHLSPRCGVTVS